MNQVIAWLAIAATFVTFAAICFIAWTTSRANAIAARAQAETQTKLIERFDSAALVEFLKTAEGRQFVREFQHAPRSVAAAHVLGGIRKGIVVGMLGLGFLAVACFWPSLGMIIPGFLLLSVAIGFSVSTWISFRLARSWRVLPPGDEGPDLP